MVQVGKNLVTGIWNGLSSATFWLWGRIKGWADNIVGGIKRFFGIHSPSRVMRDEIGKMIPPGIGVGIEMSTKGALKPMQDLQKQLTKQAAMVPLGIQQLTTPGMPLVPPARYNPTSTTPQPATSVVDRQQVTITGPLVHVGQAHIRNEQDIRELSAALRNDMDRELRGRGVVVL